MKKQKPVKRQYRHNADNLQFHVRGYDDFGSTFWPIVVPVVILFAIIVVVIMRAPG